VDERKENVRGTITIKCAVLLFGIYGGVVERSSFLVGNRISLFKFIKNNRETIAKQFGIFYR